MDSNNLNVYNNLSMKSNSYNNRTNNYNDMYYNPLSNHFINELVGFGA